LEPVTEELFDPNGIIRDLDHGYPVSDSVHGSGMTSAGVLANSEENGDSPRTRSARLVQSPFSFKPYYVAHTKIRTYALLEEGHKGTNWLQWRRK